MSRPPGSGKRNFRAPPNAGLDAETDLIEEVPVAISYGDITPMIPAAAIALLAVAVNFVVDWKLHEASGLRE